MFPNVSVFDSGQGGLTVWEPIVRRFPGLNTVYLGDNARQPYGNKGHETILRYATDALLHLSQRQAQFVVVACGTASSVAVQQMRSIFRVPVIGIVEGFCQETAEQWRQTGGRGTVAVLATRFSVGSGRFEHELRRHGVTRIWQKACPLFVNLVEEGVGPSQLAEAAAEMYLDDIPRDVDFVMLACTHFPRVAGSVARVLHRLTGRAVCHVGIDGETWLCRADHSPLPPIRLLESAPSILSQLQGFLAGVSPEMKMNLYTNKTRMTCTDSPERFGQVARFFTSLPIPEAERVHLG